MTSYQFTPANIEEIGEVLRNAFLATHANLGKEQQKIISDFWIRHLGQSRPYMMVTDTGVAEYQKIIFGKDVLRDFILLLTGNFFMLWGARTDERLGFIRNVASSVSMDLGVSDIKSTKYIAMGEQTRARLRSSDEVFEILSANPWLLILVIAPTFMSFRDFEPKEVPKARRATGGET